MSQTMTLQTRCDLCGYGGPYSRPEDFRSFGEDLPGLRVDLCRWCANDGQYSQLESGGHLVTFTDRSWSCSCGAVHRRPLFLLPRVRDAVPNMLNATAHMHVHGH